MDLSWEMLRGLEEEYGDSFHVLDLGAFHANYHEFLGAFRRIYPRTNIAYSYKTNYAPKLCQCVNLWGGYAEVVSRMEYDLALRIGVHPARILFNGPCKRESDVQKALEEGSILNLDSFHEVAMVRKVARRLAGRTVRVGIRCNFDIGGGSVSRFGVDVEGGELDRTLESLRDVTNCLVTGLHCHYSTAHRSLESYALRTRRMLELAGACFADGKAEFIDVGGGFFSRMSPDLRKQFPYPVPTYQEYAEVIAPQFAERFPGATGPELILEPGAAVAADTARFVAKVIEVRKLRSRRIALVSGSVYNIKPTLNEKDLPVRVFRENAGREASGEPIDIVGYTCTERDCLHKRYRGALATGDYVVFENVGAYTLVLKPPFIRPCPAVLAWDPESKAFEVIKRQEELSDVFTTYVFQPQKR